MGTCTAKELILARKEMDGQQGKTVGPSVVGRQNISTIVYGLSHTLLLSITTSIIQSIGLLLFVVQF